MSVKLKMKEYLIHIYSTIEHNVQSFIKNITSEKCLFRSKEGRDRYYIPTTNDIFRTNLNR